MTKEEKYVSVKLVEYWIEKHQFIFYHQLAEMVNMSDREVANYLEAVSWACIDVGLPPISAIVINVSEGTCGEGYFKTYYPQVPQNEWLKIFVRDIRLIQEKEDEWPAFLEYFKTL